MSNKETDIIKETPDGGLYIDVKDLFAQEKVRKQIKDIMNSYWYKEKFPEKRK